MTDQAEVEEREDSRPNAENIPDVLPILPLPDPLFPLAVAPIAIGLDSVKRLVDDAVRANRLLGLVALRDREIESPSPDDVYRVGTAAAILQLARSTDGTLRVAVQGLERIRIEEFTATEPYLLARVSAAPDIDAPGTETQALQRAVIELLQRFASQPPGLPQPVLGAIERLDSPRELAYFAASVVPLPHEQRQELLELDPLDAKLRRLVELLQHELSVRDLGRKITADTEERLTKLQREAVLREQLKSIQAELGETGDGGLGDLRRQIEGAGLPDEARIEAERELGRLESIPEISPEHGMVRTYLDWMATLPWSKLSGGEIDVGRARDVLDEDHYDLDKIKERILEHLAVRKLRRERGADAALSTPIEGSGETPASTGEASDLDVAATEPGVELTREPILCFVGPPGVGKTSLGQSIARALGRKFARMSLGGIHDEAEIRGHRRTYIGALPGRILQGLQRAGTRDPVYMLDEIDKVGADWRGDPTSALLEVLDPVQNKAFVDTYLGVPFDLSQVLFIATANTLDTIPPPLRDRMEILQIAGYSEEEKVHIAERYLVPQQRRANGLRDGELTIDGEALRQIIRAYTREAGVRELGRQIATICRKVARHLTEADGDGSQEPADVSVDRLVEFLGPPRFFDEAAERTDRPGVATGLAWTPVGGEVLFIEAALMPDIQQERLLLTGMLGDVMRESAQAALTYIRSDGRRFGIDPDQLAGRMVHVHVPAGASPKDGPSAGVAILAAIASIASGRPVRGDAAMTGEVTLRGKVLPVGGIKEKLLAAHRSGIRTVFIPHRNEADLEDVPPEIRDALEIIPIETADDLLRGVLLGQAEPAAPPSDEALAIAGSPGSA